MQLKRKTPEQKRLHDELDHLEAEFANNVTRETAQNKFQLSEMRKGTSNEITSSVADQNWFFRNCRDPKEVLRYQKFLTQKCYDSNAHLIP